MRKKKGSMLVEFLFISMLCGGLIAGFLSVAQQQLARKRALSAARLGTTLQATGLVSDETVERELTDHFAQTGNSGGVTWTWQKGRFTGTVASRFYDMVVTTVRASTPHGNVSESLVMQKAGNP